MPVEQRGFFRVDAGAVHSGALRDKIHRLKYDEAYGWAIIFGRLLVGPTLAASPSSTSRRS